MLVEEMIALLKKQDPKAKIRIAVGWADDTAVADKDDDLEISFRNNEVEIRGWLSNTMGELTPCPNPGEFVGD